MPIEYRNFIRASVSKIEHLPVFLSHTSLLLHVATSQHPSEMLTDVGSEFSLTPYFLAFAS